MALVCGRPSYPGNVQQRPHELDVLLSLSAEGPVPWKFPRFATGGIQSEAITNLR